MKIEAFEEQISRLRLEARADTSNLDGTAGGGMEGANVLWGEAAKAACFLQTRIGN